MAEGDADVDALCCEFFQLQVEKELGKTGLKPEEKKYGKNTAVRKILQAIGEGSMVTICEASVMSKHQDKTTKKVSDEVFVKEMLPELAKQKTKSKAVTDDKAKAELAKMKKKMADKLKEAKEGGKGAKNAAVVDRLTDTSKYTGSHQNRFDASGKGKGKEGREEIADNSGYVGNYKGQGTFDKK